VSYFEVGTALTPNHGHAALFGVFGMLALAVVIFGLRALASDAAWTRVERLVRIGCWGLNVGLALMIVLDLFPAGVLQLWDSIANGYWHARQPAFTMSGPFHALEWIRLVGDGVFLVAGVVPLVAATLMVVLAPGTRRSEERALRA
jgi:nitric oxide reductase subunit B